MPTRRVAVDPAVSSGWRTRSASRWVGSEEAQSSFGPLAPNTLVPESLTGPRCDSDGSADSTLAVGARRARVPPASLRGTHHHAFSRAEPAQAEDPLPSRLLRQRAGPPEST